MWVEVREGEATSLFSFLRLTLALLGPLWLHANVKIVSAENVTEMLVVIACVCGFG